MHDDAVCTGGYAALSLQKRDHGSTASVHAIVEGRSLFVKGGSCDYRYVRCA